VAEALRTPSSHPHGPVQLPIGALAAHAKGLLLSDLEVVRVPTSPSLAALAADLQSAELAAAELGSGMSQPQTPTIVRTAGSDNSSIVPLRPDSPYRGGPPAVRARSASGSRPRSASSGRGLPSPGVGARLPLEPEAGSDAGGTTESDVSPAGLRAIMQLLAHPTALGASPQDSASGGSGPQTPADRSGRDDSDADWPMQSDTGIDDDGGDDDDEVIAATAAAQALLQRASSPTLFPQPAPGGARPSLSDIARQLLHKSDVSFEGQQAKRGSEAAKSVAHLMMERVRSRLRMSLPGSSAGAFCWISSEAVADGDWQRTGNCIHGAPTVRLGFFFFCCDGDRVCQTMDSSG
jgi:hypothetical protein